MLYNRNDQKRQANKLGPHKPTIGRSHYTNNTYLYKAIEAYNRLPDKITRMNRFSLFKVWTKKYTKNNEIDIPENKLNPLNCTPDINYFLLPKDNNCEVEQEI